MSYEYEVMGVYSHSTKYEYKVRDDKSRYRNSTYWFVRKRGDDLYEVRPLDGRHLPSGVVKLIPREEFLKFYTPELSYYQDNPLPCLESLQKKVAMGRRLFNLNRLDHAEREFLDAVAVEDEEGAAEEEEGGLADVYAEQRKFTRLRDMVDKLLNSSEEFRETERHRFNDFGIDLRKQEQFDDSIRYYTKALEVNELDENLHFNIARAYHGKKFFDECRTHLQKALDINPDMDEAKGFLRALDAEEAEADRKAGRRPREREGKREAKKDGKKPAPPGSKVYDLKF